MDYSQKKLIDRFIQQTAQASSADPDLVELIISDQWHNAAIAARDFSEIEIACIGTVYPTVKKVEARINHYKGAMVNLSRAFEGRKHDIPAANKLKEIYLSTYQSYERLKFKLNELAHKHLEKQERHSGRFIEPVLC